MPSISVFYGITISIYYNDHLPPHIHARYAEYEASFQISDGTIIEGSIPNRAEQLIKEWILNNKEELILQWETKQFRKIPPLL